MKDTLASKTVQVAMVFAGMGLLLIVFDTALGLLAGYQVHFVIEFFSLLGMMFTAMAAKNGADNFFSYQERKTTMLAGIDLNNLPPRPVP